MKHITAAQVRYIKLGTGGMWAPDCFERDEIHFGYHRVPHDLCAAGDWTAVTTFLKEQGRISGKAKDMTREIRDFYTLPESCLWITIADRHLWWTFAKPSVIWTGCTDGPRPARIRKTVGSWQNTDLAGNPLGLDNLSSKLTQVGNYRQTICKVRAADYLLRRINVIDDPIVAQARDVRLEMIRAACALIEQLHWAEFEIMVDLIFSRSGRQRVSELGGTMADVDLVLDQPTLNERASVQVKSSATQAMLNEHIEYFQRSGIHARTFFICHSPKGNLKVPDGNGVHLWTGEKLAEMAVKSGLFDWLLERSI